MQNTTYSAGTVSVSAGGLAVTGMGTAWAVYGVRAGDMMLLGGQLAIIGSVNSNTSITLKRAWSGPAQSGAAYDVLLLDDEVRALIAANSLLQALSGGTLTSLGQIAGAANQMPYWTGAGVMEAADLTEQARSLLASALLSRSGNNLVTALAARITGGAVVSGPLDETPGLLTTVGYGGIGGKTPPTTGLTGDLNEIRTTGFYTLSTVMKNGPNGEANLAAQMIVLKRNWDAGASIVQILFPTGSGVNVAYIRIGTSAEHTFAPWRRIVTDGNVLGTCQKPNSYGHLGAIIERGSFSSGEYTKFADGTLICMGEVSFPSVNNPSGGGFVSSAVFWDFLSPFSSAGAVYAISGHAGLDCKVTAQGGSTLGSNIRLEALTSITAARSARVMAVGRWY